MDLEILSHRIRQRVPIREIPLTWANTGYSSESFNQWAAGGEFTGWKGDYPAEEEARTIVRLLGARKGDSILDIACGYGRHDVVLAEEYGLRVTGIDLSPGLIAAAARISGERGLDIEYAVMDGNNIAWVDEFDLAMIAFNSFSLFSPEDAPFVLDRVREALHRGGRLFLDLDNEPFNCRYGRFYENLYSVPGGLVFQEVYFHEGISVEVCRDLTLRDDAEEVTEFVTFKRIYTEEEITGLLRQAGFTVKEIYGDWDLAPLTVSSPKMILVGWRG